MLSQDPYLDRKPIRNVYDTFLDDKIATVRTTGKTQEDLELLELNQPTRLQYKLRVDLLKRFREHSQHYLPKSQLSFLQVDSPDSAEMTQTNISANGPLDKKCLCSYKIILERKHFLQIPDLLAAPKQTNPWLENASRDLYHTKLDLGAMAHQSTQRSSRKLPL